MDVIAPAGLVAEGLKPDSSAGVGGSGQAADPFGTLVPGHTYSLTCGVGTSIDERTGCLLTVHKFHGRWNLSPALFLK
jgi:hypothetical protein